MYIVLIWVVNMCCWYVWYVQVCCWLCGCAGLSLLVVLWSCSMLYTMYDRLRWAWDVGARLLCNDRAYYHKESIYQYTSIRCFVVYGMSYIIIKVGNIGISMCRYSSTVCVSTVGLYSIFHLDVNVCEVLLNCLST